MHTDTTVIGLLPKKDYAVRDTVRISPRSVAPLEVTRHHLKLKGPSNQRSRPTSKPASDQTLTRHLVRAKPRNDTHTRTTWRLVRLRSLG